jgi:pimeloyl-ACP methyl ester carboxylesterase
MAARIFYRIAGFGKETFLFMHGWGGEGSGSFWTPMLRHLRSSDSRFVLAHLRGRGRSGLSHDGFTTERFADDMFELADQAAARKLILVGNSMSGRWAQLVENLVARVNGMHQESDLFRTVCYNGVQLDRKISEFARAYEANSS